MVKRLFSSTGHAAASQIASHCRHMWWMACLRMACVACLSLLCRNSAFLSIGICHILVGRCANTAHHSAHTMAIIFHAIVRGVRCVQRKLRARRFAGVCFAVCFAARARVKSASGPKTYPNSFTQISYLMNILCRYGYGVRYMFALCKHDTATGVNGAGSPPASRYIIPNKFFNTLRNANGRKLSLADFCYLCCVCIFRSLSFGRHFGGFLLIFFYRSSHKCFNLCRRSRRSRNIRASQLNVYAVRIMSPRFLCRPSNKGQKKSIFRSAKCAHPAEWTQLMRSIGAGVYG